MPATGPNQAWAYDFVHDYCANGEKLKCTTPEGFPGDLAVCFETGGTLKEGTNEIVLKMEGYAPAGFIALNDLPLRSYPLMRKPENRLWYDALNFASWLRMRGVENILRANDNLSMSPEDAELLQKYFDSKAVKK